MVKNSNLLSIFFHTSSILISVVVAVNIRSPDSPVTAKMRFLAFVLVGLESRVNYPVGCEAGAFFRDPEWLNGRRDQRHRGRISTFVTPPSSSFALTAPLLTRNALSLGFRSRTLEGQALVFRAERPLQQRIHSVL